MSVSSSALLIQCQPLNFLVLQYIYRNVLLFDNFCFVLGVDVGGAFEGVLIRKHTYESLDRKASSRSWEKVYAVLRGSQLAFFKDQKHMEENILFHAEEPLNLEGCSVSVAAEYTKKKNVLSLKSPTGAEYLLQTASDEDMERWLRRLQLATGQSQGEVVARSQTLPVEGSTKAKKGFFSRGKK